MHTLYTCLPESYTICAFYVCTYYPYLNPDSVLQSMKQLHSRHNGAWFITPLVAAKCSLHVSLSNLQSRLVKESTRLKLNLSLDLRWSLGKYKQSSIWTTVSCPQILFPFQVVLHKTNLLWGSLSTNSSFVFFCLMPLDYSYVAGSSCSTQIKCSSSPTSLYPISVGLLTY